MAIIKEVIEREVVKTPMDYAGQFALIALAVAVGGWMLYRVALFFLASSPRKEGPATRRPSSSSSNGGIRRVPREYIPATFKATLRWQLLRFFGLVAYPLGFIVYLIRLPDRALFRVILGLVLFFKETPNTTTSCDEESDQLDYQDAPPVTPNPAAGLSIPLPADDQHAAAEKKGL